MKKLLVVETSPLRYDSHSNKLSNALVVRLRKQSPEVTLKIRDLISSPPPLLTKLEFGPYSEEAIQELMDADTIVFSIATHNFTIPAVLKAWVDQVAVAKKTFSYSDEGPKGLVTGKKVYLAIASGGIYSDPHSQAPDFTDKYMRSILAFLGMTDVTTFRIEGLAIPGIKETALEKAIQKIDEAFPQTQSVA